MMQFYALEQIDKKNNNDRAENECALDNEYITEEPMNLGIADRCSHCQIVLSGKAWLPPYYLELEIYRRSEFADLIMGTAFLPIVTGRYHYGPIINRIRSIGYDFGQVVNCKFCFETS